MSVVEKLEEALKNHKLRRSYRDIAEDCFFPEDLKFGKEQFAQLSSTKEWVKLSAVLKLVGDLEKTHPFVEAMDKRVEEKQDEYGDSWKTRSIDSLENRLTQNYREWLHSGDENELRKLVDLANLCRFLWLRLGDEK